MEDPSIETGVVAALVSRWAFLSTSDTAAEAARVLKPGGACAFAVWDRSELNTLLHGHHQVLLGHEGGDQVPDVRVFDTMADGRREQWLHDAGMSTIESELIHWVFDAPGQQAVLGDRARPPFGTVVVAWAAAEPVVVQEEVLERSAGHRDGDGGYRVPRSCRLYWAQR